MEADGRAFGAAFVLRAPVGFVVLSEVHDGAPPLRPQLNRKALCRFGLPGLPPQFFRLAFEQDMLGGFMTRETLEFQLLRLPSEDRAHLARVLLESLDDQPELDPAWFEEAERRAVELASGAATPIPAADALTNARRRLIG